MLPSQSTIVWNFDQPRFEFANAVNIAASCALHPAQAGTLWVASSII